MRNEKVCINNIGIQLRDHQGDGIPVVFLHYGGGNLATWSNAVPFFSKQHRVILLDLRGHGNSDRPDNGNDINTMADDVVGVMDHLNIRAANIVGSSLGAEVGLSIAANHPDRILSLVCEGAFHSEYGPFSFWQGSESDFREHVDQILHKLRNTEEATFPSIDDFVAESQRAYEAHGWWNENVEAAERYDAFKLADGSYTAGWRKHSKLDYMENYFNYRFEDYYRRAVCPILMVPGEREMKDKQFREIINTLRELASGAEIALVPGWVHPYGWLLDCENMCMEILKFLEIHDPAN